MNERHCSGKKRLSRKKEQQACMRYSGMSLDTAKTIHSNTWTHTHTHTSQPSHKCKWFSCAIWPKRSYIMIHYSSHTSHTFSWPCNFWPCLCSCKVSRQPLSIFVILCHMMCRAKSPFWCQSLGFVLSNVALIRRPPPYYSTWFLYLVVKGRFMELNLLWGLICMYVWFPDLCQTVHYQTTFM